MLDFTAPGQGPVLQTEVETRPRNVAAWVDRLPFASPIDTAQQLVMALYGLNRHTLANDDRYALMALYRPAVLRAALGLEALIGDTGMPPHPQQRQTGTLLRELHVEHVLGYKRVLEPDTRRFGRTNPARIAGAAAWSMAALRDLQAACYLTRSALPAGVWREMHQLHAFVQASKLADSVAENAPAPDLSYRQALLLALADPPHLSHVELVQTRLYLERYAGLAQLRAPGTGSARGFAVSTQDDAPPKFGALRGDGAALWLDTDALCRHLHETASRLKHGATPLSVGLPAEMDGDCLRELSRQLVQQWSGTAQRGFKRYPVEGATVQLVAGVSAIHRLLEQAPQRPEVARDDEVSIGDVGLTVAAPIAVNTTQWTVTNDSATGLALAGTPTAPLNLRVGDALALRNDETASWSLGAVRWVRMVEGQRIELGVERLAPQMEPVWVRPLRGERKASPEPALFLPGLPGLKQPDRLLLPRHLYHAGMDAEVWHAPRQYALTFGRCLEHSPGFDLIDFTVFADEQP